MCLEFDTKKCQRSAKFAKPGKIVKGFAKRGLINGFRPLIVWFREREFVF